MLVQLRIDQFNACLILIFVMLLFTGCNDSSNKTTEQTLTTSSYDEFLTIDVFCSQANYQGIQSGWFAKVVKDRFNMELNIIAPNVSGGGDTLFHTRSAAGNLGDIVMISAENGRLEEAIQAGLLYDITEMVKKSDNLIQYSEGIVMLQNAVHEREHKIYAMPSSVSSKPPNEPSEGLDLVYGPYLRWDYYQAIGAPPMSTLEDLLPVLKSMQDAFPLSDTGEKSYALSLFKDWDDNMMTFAKQPACFYGYDEVGFLLNRADGIDMQSIISEDSLYIRSLEFYFTANQMGILDPESATQNWTSLQKKYVDGAILFSPWPWLGQSEYNTLDHKEQGKGFMFAPIDDIEIFFYGATPSGTKYVVGVGANAQDPQRMIDFIDWLYSPEGIMMSTSQTGDTSGPMDLTWTMINNRPELTDFGKLALLNGNATMPEEWGGGSWKDGTSQLNFTSVLHVDINPLNGEPYNYNLWDSVIELKSTPLDLSWQAYTGALSTIDYLTQHNQYVTAPGTNHISESESAHISRLRSQCNAVIIENSWKMIFAQNETEFNTLLNNMQTTVMELGYEEVLEFDLKQAKALNRARKETLNPF